MAVSIAEFLDRLAASGILADAELAAVRAEVDGLDRNTDAEPFIKKLHKQGRITGYQAQALWKGKGDKLAFGNYVIEDELGRGGMGVVLKARHKRMQRYVAIKVLPAAMVKDAAAIARFQREVVAAAQLTHSNIVGAFDADEINGQHILVMEYVNGRDLSSIVKKQGPLTVAQAVDYVIQAARGLEFAHKQGVIHRDIKPANLLLDNQGTVKILDMGLARFSDSADVGTQAELTGTGTIMGTVDYMSPEQALSTKSADARSDIYSLGITLYYLLTGKPAYTGDSLMARMMAHANQPIPLLQDDRPDVPAGVQAAFVRMVAKQPADRYQSMTEVIANLETCCSDRSATSPLSNLNDAAGMSVSGASGFLNALNAGNSSANAATQTAPSPGRQTDASPNEVTVVAGATSGTMPSIQVKSTRNRQPANKFLPTDGRVLIGGTVGLVALLAMIVTFSRNSLEQNPVTPTGVASRNGLVAPPDPGTSPQGVTGSAGAPPPAVAPFDAPADGLGNHALEFDGQSSYVDTGLRLPEIKQLTIEAKIRTNKLGGDSQQILCTAEGSGFALKLDKNGTPQFDFGGPVSYVTLRDDNPAPIGDWQHLAAVFDGEQIRLYRDGQTTTLPLDVSEHQPSQLALTIGANENRANVNKSWHIQFFSGTIDEVRISDIARYREDYTPVDRFEPDEHTLALYHFDEGTGNVLKDSSGHGYDGRIERAKWVRVDESQLTAITPGTGGGWPADAPSPAVAPFDAAQATAHQEAWAKYFGVPVEYTNGIGMKFRLIPPGEYLMGSTDEQIAAALKAADEIGAAESAKDRIRSAERPQHRVFITKPFLMSATEVSIGQFKKFAAATGYQTDAEKAVAAAKAVSSPEARLISPNPVQTYLSPRYPVTDDSPAAVITWNDAVAYCQWLSEQESQSLTPGGSAAGGKGKLKYRLPTEAEWEYACRAGTTTQYSFGDDYAELPKYGWHNQFGGKSHPVATLSPNPFGLFDMHGNLYEWCGDYWDENWYQKSAPHDPIGPPIGTFRVSRGSSWLNNASTCRSAYRISNAPSDLSNVYGFRVVAELDTTPKAATGSPVPAITAPRWPFDPPDGREYVWSVPENLGPMINTGPTQHVWGVSDDETTLYVWRDTTVYVARRANIAGPFTELEALSNISTTHYLGAISGDGLHAAIVQSSSTAGRGKIDELFLASRLNESAPFSAPVLATSVSDPSLDRPVLSADGLTLLALSVRDNRETSADVWMFTRSAPDLPFSTGEKLPGAINTPNWDMPCHISNDRCFVIGMNQKLQDRTVRYFTRVSATDPFGPGWEIDVPWNPAASRRIISGFRLAGGGRALYFESGTLSGAKAKFEVWVIRRVPKPGS